MKNYTGLLARSVAVVLGTGVIGQCALARVSEQGPSLSVGVGAEHTDNAYRNDAFKQSETKEYVDVDLGYLRSGERLSADILYNAELANYEHDTTQQNSVVQGHGTVTWQALPDRLSFDMSHDRSEQLRDSRSPDIRNNKEIRNISSAGPTFTARLGSVDNLVLSGRYIDVTYDDATNTQNPSTGNSDSTRLQGTVSWQHHLSKTDVLSLSYQRNESDFDSNSPDFTYDRIYGTYDVHLASSSYTVSLGANRSERDGGSSNDGFMAQVAYRLETGGHRVGLVVVRELTDSGLGLGNSSLTSEDFHPGDSNFGVIDMVERSRVDVHYGYDRLCDRCRIDFGYSFDEQDFDTQPRDEKQNSINGAFGYQLTPTLKASLKAAYAKTDYQQGGIIIIQGIPTPVGRSDKRYQYGAVLDWMMSRMLTASFWVREDERKADTASREYNEVYFGMSVKYRYR